MQKEQPSVCGVVQKKDAIVFAFAFTVCGAGI